MATQNYLKIQRERRWWVHLQGPVIQCEPRSSPWRWGWISLIQKSLPSDCGGLEGGEEEVMVVSRLPQGAATYRWTVNKEKPELCVLLRASYLENNNHPCGQSWSLGEGQAQRSVRRVSEEKTSEYKHDLSTGLKDLLPDTAHEASSTWSVWSMIL